LKERIPGDEGPEVRERSRVTMACAVMALLCIREAQHPQHPHSLVSTLGATQGGAASSAANVGGATRGGGGREGKSENGAVANAEGNGASKVKQEVGREGKAVVLERRMLVQLVRVLQASVDSVAYGGVNFSLESALYALPAAVASAGHVAILSELGIVELLVAVVKQLSTSITSDSAAGGGSSGGAERAATNAQQRDSSEANLRVLALCVRVMRCMCSSEHGASTQGVCVQRLSIVGAQTVMTTLAQHLDTEPPAAPSSSTAPASPTQTHSNALTRLILANVTKRDILEDANIVLQMLSKALPLSSP